jgi:hypothetical protein
MDQPPPLVSAVLPTAVLGEQLVYSGYVKRLRVIGNYSEVIVNHSVI